MVPILKKIALSHGPESNLEINDCWIFILEPKVELPEIKIQPNWEVKQIPPSDAKFVDNMWRYRSDVSLDLIKAQTELGLGFGTYVDGELASSTVTFRWVSRFRPSFFSTSNTHIFPAFLFRALWLRLKNIAERDWLWSLSPFAQNICDLWGSLHSDMWRLTIHLHTIWLRNWDSPIPTMGRGCFGSAPRPVKMRLSLKSRKSLPSCLKDIWLRVWKTSNVLCSNFAINVIKHLESAQTWRYIFVAGTPTHFSQITINISEKWLKAT